MKLDPNKYLGTLRTFKDRLLSADDPRRTATELAVGSHVPALAVVLYAMRDDVLGQRQDLLNAQASLTQFYGYSEVEPWNDLVGREVPYGAKE
ncbi:MAG: hypothetical protein IT285_16145 [Bdellovibrionales bacterium]|nr:hypothetical protein [Bdellovibrionales bacterium]